MGEKFVNSDGMKRKIKNRHGTIYYSGKVTGFYFNSVVFFATIIFYRKNLWLAAKRICCPRFSSLTELTGSIYLIFVYDYF